MDLKQRIELLKKHRKVTVIGISANPARPSHWITRYLIEQGYDVIAVNPGLPRIDGVRVVASVADAVMAGGPLEIVDVFRSPDAIPSLIEELAPHKPAVIWLQPGAENPEAEARARDMGLKIISGECIYADHHGNPDAFASNEAMRRAR